MKKTFDIKDIVILSSWVAVILVLISIVWIFSNQLQAHYLLRSVNSMFINGNDSRRLVAYTPKNRNNSELMGYWFTMQNTEDKMFVFSVFRDGILVPLGAIVTDNGFVDEVIPLSRHAIQVFPGIPRSILQIHINRIENEMNINSGERR